MLLEVFSGAAQALTTEPGQVQSASLPEISLISLSYGELGRKLNPWWRKLENLNKFIGVLNFEITEENEKLISRDICKEYYVYNQEIKRIKKFIYK